MNKLFYCFLLTIVGLLKPNDSQEKIPSKMQIFIKIKKRFLMAKKKGVSIFFVAINKIAIRKERGLVSGTAKLKLVSNRKKMILLRCLH